MKPRVFYGLVALGVFLAFFNFYPLLSSPKFESVDSNELSGSSNDPSPQPKKPDIYYFWFLCLACKKTNDAVFKAAEEYKDKINFRFVDVTKDPDADLLARLFGATGVPYLVFLDENGNVLKKKAGETLYPELKGTIEELYMIRAAGGGK